MTPSEQKTWLQDHVVRQAIQTVYFGPTNMKGTRVRAQASAGTVWHDWDHALNSEANHLAAAVKLCDKFKWFDYSVIVGGGLIRDGSYVWTLGAP